MMRQSRFTHYYKKIMKKLAHIAVLALAVSSWAQAQVDFGPGSARPINSPSATRALERPMPEQGQTRTAPKPQRVLVECRDGSRHIARVCRRHGGVARSRMQD
jgi:hypothetical protein